MQRYSLRNVLSLFFIIALGTALTSLTGCGGSSSNKVSSLMIYNVNDTAFSTPLTALPLTFGDTPALTTRAENSKNVVLAPTVTWCTSNNMIADVSPTGEVCAGHWHDTTYIQCDPATAAGTATITAAAGGMTATLTVNVHPRITAVIVTPATSVACTSQTQTLQYTATALSGTTDVTSFSGTPVFTSSAAAVATVDANGLVTSAQPGATQIFANFAGVISQPATFVSCPPATITLHLSTDPAGTNTTSFNLNVGDTKTLTANVTDTLGNAITGLPLTYSSASPASVGVSTAGTITAAAPGFSTVLASCSPFLSAEGNEVICNPANGTNAPGAGVPVYSNLVTAAVAGTSSTTVYVTGATAADGTATNKTLLPITTSNNTAGTAITLPDVPNSMMFAPNGTTLYIGTPTGLVTVDPATNTASTQLTNVLGTILTVSPDGTKVVLNNPTVNGVTIYDTTNPSSGDVIPIVNVPGVTAAAYSPDSYKLFLAAPGKIYVVVNGSTTHASLSPTPRPPASPPSPKVCWPTSRPASSNAIQAIGVCNNALITGPTVGNAPALLAAAPDGTRLIGVGAAWNNIAYTVSSIGCPPVVSETASAAAYSGSAPTQLTVTSDSKYAFVTGEGAAPVTALPFYNIAAAAPGSAPIANGGGILTTGGATNDGTQLYVGIKTSGAGTVNALHRFDLTQPTPTDATQIPTTFAPEFVAVQPK